MNQPIRIILVDWLFAKNDPSGFRIFRNICVEFPGGSNLGFVLRLVMNLIVTRPASQQHEHGAYCDGVRGSDPLCDTQKSGCDN
jgi:hypothetical protein